MARIQRNLVVLQSADYGQKLTDTAPIDGGPAIPRAPTLFYPSLGAIGGAKPPAVETIPLVPVQYALTAAMLPAAEQRTLNATTARTATAQWWQRVRGVPIDAV